MDQGSANLSNTSLDNSAGDAPYKLSGWAKNLKITRSLNSSEDDSTIGTPEESTFGSLIGIGLPWSPRSPMTDSSSDESPPSTSVSNFFETLTKGIVDSSKSAVKAVLVKARHVVSQNKRRYQEGGFDLDLTYITENIIAMGFPAGDKSSGFFGYVEGFYRNHMEEVMKFLETHHKNRYKVYNLCSERLYDASLFGGKVATFPFDDHNCPPLQLITLFCQSAYSWLKEDIENIVVVHCKAGMARTGLLISSLLLHLKFFPTSEESIDYYNQKRCFDGKGLVLPSQIRYVKYFERVLTYFNGVNQPGRRCLLREFRLHRCPYWIRTAITVSDHDGVLFSTEKHPRTKNLSPEDFWFAAPRTGIVVFVLLGEPGLTELAGDFKIHFHDRQGDFYCWLNTSMIEDRTVLNTADLDGFDKRKLPSPGFQLEVVLVGCDGASAAARAQAKITSNEFVRSANDFLSTGASPGQNNPTPDPEDANQKSRNTEKGNVFADNEAQEMESARGKQTREASNTNETDNKMAPNSDKDSKPDRISALTNETENATLGSSVSAQSDRRKDNTRESMLGEFSDFKVVSADASVFSFGDEEDYESD